MSHGGLAVSVGIMVVGVGFFVFAYPAVFLDSSARPVRAVAGARPGWVTARRWAQFCGLLAAAVGVGLGAVGFITMF